MTLAATARARRLAAQRNLLSDRWLPALRRLVSAEERRRIREAASAIAEGSATWAADLPPVWTARMARILNRFALPLAVEGYVTAHVPAKRLAVDLDSPELASARLRVPITRWIQMTCDLNSQSDVRRVVALQRRAAMEWLTVDQIAREIRQVGIVQSAARAESLSRTVTIYAYNEGSFRSYKDAGAQGVEWLVTEDDVTCEECMALDGKRIGFDGEFVADGISPQHPPLHPRCRCSLIPVIRGANG